MLTIRHTTASGTSHYPAPDGVHHETNAVSVIGGPVLTYGTVQVLNHAGVIIDSYRLDRAYRPEGHSIPAEY